MSAEHLAGPYREPLKHPPPEGDPAARRAIELELEEGERLLWAGQPPQGVRFTALDVFLIPFSLVWGGFAIFWEVLAIMSGAPFFFALFGAPFVAVGLYLMVGRFFMSARERARTFYGVTDRRALIVVNNKQRAKRSMDLEKQSSVHLSESKNGSGSILFSEGPLNLAALKTPKVVTGPVVPEPLFEKIRNARAVYQIIKDAQDDLQERRRIRVEEPVRDDNAQARGESEGEGEVEEELAAPKGRLRSM